jgi:hypothetical protein
VAFDLHERPEPHLHGFRVSYAHAPIEKLRPALLVVAEELTRRLRAAPDHAAGAVSGAGGTGG